MEDLNVGDVVLLKSGGPKMTIVSIDEQVAETIWFDGPRQMGGKFNVLLLTKPQRPRMAFTGTVR